MRVAFAGLPGRTDVANEDWAGASLDVAVALDGVLLELGQHFLAEQFDRTFDRIVLEVAELAVAPKMSVSMAIDGGITVLAIPIELLRRRCSFSAHQGRG